MSGPVDETSTSRNRLQSWKDIASHFGKSLRTVQSWEKNDGLPVRRDQSGVFAYVDELDAWARSREVPPRGNVSAAPPEPDSVLHDVVVHSTGPWLMARWRAFTAVLFLGIFFGVVFWVYGKRKVDPRPAPDLVVGPPSPRLFVRATAENGKIPAISLPEEFHQIVLSPDQKRAYLALQRTRKLAMVDIATLKVEPWEAPFDIRSIAVSPDGERLFVGSFVDGLAQIDAHTGRVLNQVPTRGPVSDIAISRDGRRAYLAMMPRGVRRYSLDSREWKQITTLGCPYFCSIDGLGTKLLVSYQCGGPTGRDGHDAIEVFDLPSERSIRTFSGPPLVGMEHAFFPDGDRVWLAGGDACSREVYDREGCPDGLNQIHYVFRVSDGRILRSIPLPLPFGLWPILFGNGERVLVGYARQLGVLGTTRFAPLESYRYVSADTASDAVIADQVQKVLLTVPTRKELWVINTDASGCDDAGPGVAHHFSGDGTEHDSIDNAHIQQPPAYAPGFVGQAFKFTGNGRSVIHAPSDFHAGEGNSTVALYVKPEDHTEATLLERGDTVEYWRLTTGPAGIGFEFKPKSGAPVIVRTDRILRPGEWTHLAVTQTEQHVALFVDGVQVANAAGSPGIVQPYLGLQDYPFGWSPTKQNTFRGLVDELILWSRALSPDEVRAIYRRRLEAPCKL